MAWGGPGVCISSGEWWGLWERRKAGPGFVNMKKRKKLAACLCVRAWTGRSRPMQRKGQKRANPESYRRSIIMWFRSFSITLIIEGCPLTRNKANEAHEKKWVLVPGYELRNGMV